MQTLKAGTRIEFFVSHPQGRNETATIVRWTAISGPIKNEVRGNKGWHIVKFADGGRLCMHETGFRVIDNRSA